MEGMQLVDQASSTLHMSALVSPGEFSIEQLRDTMSQRKSPKLPRHGPSVVCDLVLDVAVVGACVLGPGCSLQSLVALCLPH